MTPIRAAQFEAFADAARRVAAYGLLRCSSGNLSWRVDEQRMLVTATRLWMERTTPDDVVVCRIADCTSLNGLTPSIEARFHAGALRERPEMNVVLHYQSPCATAIACGPWDGLDFNVLPEMPYYIGPVGDVPFLLPGSEELAQAVVGALKTHDLALMRNHGQVVLGRSFDDAIQKALFFELVCEILVHRGGHVEPLPAGAVAQLSASDRGRAV